MPTAYVRADILYAWNGSSLVIVSPSGMAGPDLGLSGFYYREARFLRTLDLTLNGVRPWLCEAAQLDPTRLVFAYVHPELADFGGGGTGQSQDEESSDEKGLPHRSVSVSISYAVRRRGLAIALDVVNHARHNVAFDAAVRFDADFLDIQDAFPAGAPPPRARVDVEGEGNRLVFTHCHERLPYTTTIDPVESSGWWWEGTTLRKRFEMTPHEARTLRVNVLPGGIAPAEQIDDEGRQEHVTRWREAFTRIAIPGNRIAEAILRSNIRDFASFALMEGPQDEWLTLQAGMPLYPALFGRDSLTAGWQAAVLDRGASLEASLTTLGRMQSTRINEWRDEEPGRIPYQVRRGPQAILELNPYAAYYADFASPLMFVIALVHLYAWTGERQAVEKHWDTVRRILDWARTYGDKDGDGYLEYQTRSTRGTKNQGWKDSGDAIVYDDGTPVPAPIATCEIQGYWFAAQQLTAVLCGVMGAADQARAYWRAAMELKERFNRDWWAPDQQCIGLALDPSKRLVTAATSNIGHCIATGIVSTEHLPATVGRLFAPDMFSGWGIRTLSSSHHAYNPVSYHRGSVWAVEQATIAFGLRRFGFDARALDLARAAFDLASLYPEYRIPECVGGWSRGERPTPGAYPRANTPQLWNASSMALFVHTLLGLQPVAALNLLVVDPVLPDWLPEVVLERVRLGDAVATLRFWRDADGTSHAEIVRKQGTLRLVHQPPLESLTAGVRDRMAALFDTVVH